VLGKVGFAPAFEDLSGESSVVGRLMVNSQSVDPVTALEASFVLALSLDGFLAEWSQMYVCGYGEKRVRESLTREEELHRS
jgi:hypothetical protein